MFLCCFRFPVQRTGEVCPIRKQDGSQIRTMKEIRMQCKALALLVAVFSFLATLSAAAQQAVEEPARPAIEQIVREYILQHPEVIIESFRLYKEREQTAQKEQS